MTRIAINMKMFDAKPQPSDAMPNTPMLEHAWIERNPRDRAVRVTPAGRSALAGIFGPHRSVERPAVDETPAAGRCLDGRAREWREWLDHRTHSTEFTLMQTTSAVSLPSIAGGDGDGDGALLCSWSVDPRTGRPALAWKAIDELPRAASPHVTIVWPYGFTGYSSTSSPEMSGRFGPIRIGAPV